MNLQTIDKDIKDLTKALQIVENTENYLHYNKSALILNLCESINALKEKRDNQILALKKLTSN